MNYLDDEGLYVISGWGNNKDEEALEEWSDDVGMLVITNNSVDVKRGQITYEDVDALLKNQVAQ